jgi:hypothetical protein
MGTRALISINRKPFIATHWDGDPAELGLHLLGVSFNGNFKRNIILVAKEHVMDAVDTTDDAFTPEIDARFQEISNKTNGKYTAEQLKEMHCKDGSYAQFGVMGAGDWPICDIKDYRDYAEYQYDFTAGKLTYRKLKNAWLGNKHGRMKLLTHKSIDNWIIKRDKAAKIWQEKYAVEQAAKSPAN